MRVIQGNSFHYRRGGDSIHFLSLADALAARGHQVALFAMHHPENLPSPWSAYWVPNVEYRGELSAAQRLRAVWRSTYSLEAGRKMRALLADFRPDVAHFHNVHHHLTLAAVEATLRSHVSVVWTLHDYRTVCPATHLLRDGRPCQRCAGGRFWHGVMGRCKSGELARSLAAVAESYLTRWAGWLRKVDCYVAPSEFLAGTVRRMGLPARRVEVVPNPISATGRPVFDGRNADEVLYVGRLSPEKGVDVLLRAIAGLHRVRLHVVGDGPEGGRLQALAQDLGLAGRVAFLGWRSSEEVSAAMQRAALLCVPSVSYENCPGVVLEAMSVGLPVLASDLGGLTELVDGGRAGWLAQPGDVGSWRAAMAEALTDQAASRERAEAAYERVRERHDPVRFVERIEEIYRSVIREAG